MKTTIILIILLLTSCTQHPKSISKDSTQIVSDYVDTLENSIVDAKSVMKDLNKRNKQFE
jgi:starvation-inducible outer membrane lipoprotein